MKKFLASLFFLSSLAFSSDLLEINEAYLESQMLSEQEAEFSCVINVQIFNLRIFKSGFDANRFCSGLGDFCFTRRFSDSQYETSYRNNFTFRGRSNNGQRSARGNAYALFDDFLIGSNLHQRGFGYRLNFGRCF